MPDGVDVEDYHMLSIQAYIEAGYEALVERPFSKALDLGGTDCGNGWFYQLWRGKIKKADFLVPDLDIAHALVNKRDAVQVAKKKTYIHSIFNR